MNNFGKFIRKLSTDTENENKAGLISGTTKLFDSVNSRTNDLVSGLSSTFEQIKRRTSIDTLSFTDRETIKEEEHINYDNNQNYPRSDLENNIQQPPMYNEQPNRPLYNDAKSYIEQTASEQLSFEREIIDNNQLTSNMKPPPPPPPPPMQDVNSTFKKLPQTDIKPTPIQDINPLSKKLPPPKPPPPLTKQKSTPHEEEKPASERFSRSQTLADRDIVEDMKHHEYLKKESGIIANEVLQDARSQLEQLTQLECQKIVSAMGEMIGDGNGNLGVEHLQTGHSSPSEYGGDEGDQPIYGDVEQQAKNIRKMSEVSIESDGEEMTEEHKVFLENLISTTFNEKCENPLENSLTRFHKIIQIRPARAWIARLIEQQTYARNTKHVTEIVFYRLLHILTLVLLECLENEDYLPARDLLLMAYSCSTDIKCGPQKTIHQFYLSSCISSHPIWKSIHFWSFCFFNAVQDVRSKRATMRRNSANTTDADGVAFHQLQVHLNYMRSIGLPVGLCSEFVRKQVNIVNLTDDEMSRLKEVMDSWKD